MVKQWSHFIYSARIWGKVELSQNTQKSNLYLVGNTAYKNSSVELVKTVLTLGFFSEKKNV